MTEATGSQPMEFYSMGTICRYLLSIKIVNNNLQAQVEQTTSLTLLQERPAPGPCTLPSQT